MLVCRVVEVVGSALVGKKANNLVTASANDMFEAAFTNKPELLSVVGVFSSVPAPGLDTINDTSAFRSASITKENTPISPIMEGGGR